MEPLVLAAGLLGAAAILSTSLYAFGRLRIEQEKTLQKLIDRGLSGDELLAASGLAGRGTNASRDLRRGLLLLALGLSWSGVTYFVGGKAWIFGVFPVSIGTVYLVFRILDGRRG